MKCICLDSCPDTINCFMSSPKDRGILPSLCLVNGFYKYPSMNKEPNPFYWFSWSEPMVYIYIVTTVYSIRGFSAT